MKRAVISVLLSVLVLGAAVSQVPNIVATFSDTETSTDNLMCSGNLTLKFVGSPMEIPCGIACKWYETEWTLVNLGTRSAIAALTLLDTTEYPLLCIEDALGPYRDPATGGVIPDNASSEPEGVSEEGGRVGSRTIPPPDPSLSPDENLALGNALGQDTSNIHDHVELRVWFDSNGDGNFTSDELMVDGKISGLSNTRYELGELPVDEGAGGDGGWGQYFTYRIQEVDGEMVTPLVVAQTDIAGSVVVSNDSHNLYVTYDTTDTDWYLTETHLYVGKNPPPTMAPGKFPHKDDPLPKGTETWTYTIPLDTIPEYILKSGKLRPVPGSGGVEPGDDVYIAAHAVACKKKSICETGWARPGGQRGVKIAVHLQQVEDPTWDSDPQLRWWPTNAYQGDKVVFNILFELGQGEDVRHWHWTKDSGWTFDIIKRGVFDRD